MTSEMERHAAVWRGLEHKYKKMAYTYPSGDSVEPNDRLLGMAIAARHTAESYEAEAAKGDEPKLNSTPNPEEHET